MGEGIFLMHSGGVLASIEITQNPTKMKYSTREGSNFDTKGMIVTAVYANGVRKAITGYSYSPTHWNRTGTNKTVTISYSENGGDIKTATLSGIEVIPATLHYDFTPVSGYAKKIGPVVLQTETFSIDEDYQTSSEFKVWWKLTQSREEDNGKKIVYNAKDNYRTYLVKNSSSDIEVGNSPYSGWGAEEQAEYWNGTTADGTKYPKKIGKVTSASLKFVNTASTNIYLTLEGAILITTAL